MTPNPSERLPFHRSRPFLWLLIGVVAAAAVWYTVKNFTGIAPQKAGAALPVRIARAQVRDMPVYFQGLGTVTPVNTVLVKSRVDGQLMSLHFAEGQEVKAGELLAVIDPRPYQVQRDQALLKDARLDLARYRRLIKEESVSAQKLQAQEALVGQYMGAVATDKANVADAELLISYCNITAPVSGRLGLKQVDAGNMIRASDAEGIVVITQMRPMHVVFTLLERQLPEVVEAMTTAAASQPPKALEVEAWDQGWKIPLEKGRLLTIDNQIDSATGTIKAKAEFDNESLRLFPNQFVNARLLVQTLQDALTVPSSGVQRNNDGFFIYRVDPSKNTVHIAPVKTGHTTSDLTVITEGLKAGDILVIDGTDRLREGMKVSFDEGTPENR